MNNRRSWRVAWAISILVIFPLLFLGYLFLNTPEIQHASKVIKVIPNCSSIYLGEYKATDYESQKDPVSFLGERYRSLILEPQGNDLTVHGIVADNEGAAAKTSFRLGDHYFSHVSDIAFKFSPVDDGQVVVTATVTRDLGLFFEWALIIAAVWLLLGMLLANLITPCHYDPPYNNVPPQPSQRVAPENRPAQQV